MKKSSPGTFIAMSLVASVRMSVGRGGNVLSGLVGSLGSGSVLAEKRVHEL